MQRPLAVATEAKKSLMHMKNKYKLKWLMVSFYALVWVTGLGPKVEEGI